MYVYAHARSCTMRIDENLEDRNLLKMDPSGHDGTRAQRGSNKCPWRINGTRRVRSSSLLKRIVRRDQSCTANKMLAVHRLLVSRVYLHLFVYVCNVCTHVDTTTDSFYVRERLRSGNTLSTGSINYGSFSRSLITTVNFWSILYNA